MVGFLREHSLPIVCSVLLHGLLAAALLYTAMVSVQPAAPSLQPIPIDAVVVDSQVLRAAQRAVTERAEEDAARARAAAERQQAEAAAAAQAQTEAQQQAEEATRAVAAEKEQAALKAVAEAHAVDLKRAEDARRAEDAKRAQDTKRASEAKSAEDARRSAEAKQAEDAKHAADQKAKSEREAELRRQLADEERANAVQSSPLRDQYMARLQSRIQSAWIRPPSARVGLDCLVQVTQLPGGEVTDAHVTQCNGDAATSSSIVNAVYRASPLPIPPDPALFSRTFAFHFHPDQ